MTATNKEYAFIYRHFLSTGPVTAVASQMNWGSKRLKLNVPWKCDKQKRFYFIDPYESWDVLLISAIELGESLYWALAAILIPKCNFLTDFEPESSRSEFECAVYHSHTAVIGITVIDVAIADCAVVGYGVGEWRSQTTFPLHHHLSPRGSRQSLGHYSPSFGKLWS